MGRLLQSLGGDQALCQPERAFQEAQLFPGGSSCPPREGCTFSGTAIQY